MIAMTGAAASQAGTKALYLYALVPADADGEAGCRGLDDAPLCHIASGHVAVVASEVTRPVIRPERRHIASSQAVQRKLLDRGDVLPMAFGTVAADRTAVIRLLESRQAEFAALLARVAGKVEMGLRVSLCPGRVFRIVLEREPALKAQRDRTLRASRRASRDQLIRTGQMVEAALDRLRADVRGTVAESLQRHAVDIEVLTPRSEDVLADLACLVPRVEAPLFAQWVAEAAADFGEEFIFDYSGPWPPHHFGSLHLNA